MIGIGGCLREKKIATVRQKGRPDLQRDARMTAEHVAKHLLTGQQQLQSGATHHDRATRALRDARLQRCRERRRFREHSIGAGRQIDGPQPPQENIEQRAAIR